MVKKYNVKDGVLTFESKLYVLNPDKSFATLIPPFPALEKIGILNKDDELIVTITKKKK